jgi:hypothetical protein
MTAADTACDYIQNHKEDDFELQFIKMAIKKYKKAAERERERKGLIEASTATRRRG